MANSFVANIPEDFDLQAKAEELASLYQRKGYTARATKMKESARISIEKNCGGVNMILGLGESITVNLSKQGTDTLMVSFSDAEWTSKIIGCVAGFFCCLIPFITAIIGTTKQLSLPKDIEKEVYALVNN